MHFRARAASLLAACSLGVASHAAAQQPSVYDSLTRRLGNITARIDSLEAGACPAAVAARPVKRTGDARVDSLAAGLDRIERRFETLRAGRCTNKPAAQPADTTDDLAALRAAASAAAGQPPPSPGDTTRPEPARQAPPPSGGG